MSLSEALSAAISGLRATQSGLSIVAANVANAETPGYVRKTVTQVATSAGDAGIGVRVTAVNRELDSFVQKQLQVETSGGAYADLQAQLYQRLQQVYGQPGSGTTLDATLNNFTTALQALSTSPDASAAQSSVLSSAQALAQQLNGMSADIQQIRSDSEAGISDAVSQANDAMTQIARINQQLSTTSSSDGTVANLLDQRDTYITQLSQLMDIRVIPTDNNQVNVFTSSGVQLVGNQAAHLTFDSVGALTASSQWSADPSQRSVGTISLQSATGGSMDLVANNAIRSGKIAAYLQMRDQVLPQAQAQLDELAASMSSALSDHTTPGTATPPGPQSGFDVDTAGLQAGNTINLTYTDNFTGAQRKVTIVRVDDPTALPLSASATSDPNDKVVGVDFSGGTASVASQLNAALGATGLQFSNPSGTTLRVLDDGATNKVDVNAVSTTATETSLTAGTAELPFFVDGSAPYTGAITADGSESVGLAGRIAVNSTLLADPTKLTTYQTSPATAAGDPTRPNFLYNQLASNVMRFSARAGIGTTSSPFNGTVSSYLGAIISQQGEAASAATGLQQGQDIVVNSLQQRLNDSSGVNVDTEMANLLTLQTAYSANARVMTTVRDLLTALMQM